uniref:Piwi-like protein 1 isoform X1 n=1 Tax=Crassostrea virginica TaxID=6565 RepID=A0A8B8ENG7_CRAVI|nr:piwi-like protein 1 isoform X1 [Crassostrea virginica]XP_022341464.1 piwi-like protein 1 isoform X1 [Crassostrea virginica]XP_022341465.1 piwi-like protein 1 isoform X1 [Crassostrea virginica]
MSGRGRARARGRARGASEDQARRPGEQQSAPPREPPSAAPAPAPAAGPPAASGRASYRGGAREPRPGIASGSGDVPADELSKMSIGTRDAGQRRDRSYYTDPECKPAWVTDKRGTSGSQLPVVTNYFKLEMAPDWHLYQYHVDFNPPIDSRKMRMALLMSHENLLGRTKAFDGMILYLPKRLQEKVTEVYSQRKTDDAQIRITITLTNELPPSSPQVMQVYNIIFRRVLAMIEMKQIGRNYFNPALSVNIPQHKLTVMPGFVTAIAKYESDTLLCADISHKIMRSDTLLDLMYDLYGQSRGDTFYDDCVRKFVGSIVLTRYNNKTYRIDDFDWDKRPDYSFQLRNDVSITLAEYYRKNYNIEIKDMNQPLVVSRPKKKDIRMGRTQPIYLLPELCTVTGLSDEARADFSVMKDVGAHTRVAPEGRNRTLQDFINQINSNEKVKAEMSGWGLAFSQRLMNVSSRIAPQEKIYQKGGAELMYRAEDADWSRDMRGKQLITPVNLENWVIVFTRRNSAQAQDLVQNLSRVGPPMGMRINSPTICELQDDRNDSYITALKQYVTEKTQLALTILPTNRKDRYDAIKKFCCVDHPVPSQCVVQRTLSKKQMLMSVATKIAIQLNCKLGGEVWCLDIPKGALLKNLMVVGVDTYHDSAKKGRSVGGVICSLNQKLTRYYSRTTFQHTAEELINGLVITLRGALEKYHEVNGVLPERIIVFRDGVGDGQLGAVYEHEVPQLNECFKRSGGQDYNPKVAIVVVKKRINTRFFAKAGPSMTNPPPGTIVDTVVTRPIWYDFFLVSQSVKQGTVTPTHYNVIWDTTGLKPDHMQRLSYKMTHLYYNWPGTIRVPAPCQYAHKLAFLVGQSIHKDPSMVLSDRLYFL